MFGSCFIFIYNFFLSLQSLCKLQIKISIIKKKEKVLNVNNMVNMKLS